MAQQSSIRRWRRTHIAWLAVILTAGALTERGAQAHKAVTSKYQYNEDIYPIFRERCGRCHVDGGPAPMSLLTYNDALPWAQSIRDELTAEKMPPWYVDPSGPAIKGGQTLTPREIDMVVTWAAGGTPQGNVARKPPAPEPVKAQWRAGKPDLVIPMESEHSVGPGKMEDSLDVTLPTNLSDTKWVKTADLLPGEPSMVRDATISVENGPVLCLWVPGSDPTTAPSGAAFKVPAGAKIHLQIRYKKHWQDEQANKTDRSSVGLYFTDPPASGRELQALSIAGPSAEAPEARTFTGSLTGPGRIVAVRPTLDFPYGSLNVHAVTPTGSKVPLLALSSPQPEWRRRYWLAEPIELPAGTKVEVVVAPPAVSTNDPIPPKRHPLEIALDYVPQ